MPQNRGAAPEPLFEIMRQGMDDWFEGMDDHTLRAIALGAVSRAKEFSETRKEKFYREPYFYAINVGTFGTQAATIAAAATAAAPANRADIDPSSNFEAYYAMRSIRDAVALTVNGDNLFRTRTLVTGAGAGATSEDPAATVADQLLGDNGFGQAVRPQRFVWPRIFPAGGTFEVEYVNNGPNARDAQFGFFGNKVYRGDNPRKISAKPPYRREPFTFAISWNAIGAGVASRGSIALLTNADFELYAITQSSPAGITGDFECQVAEASGGNKELSNIALRRDVGYGTVERPTLLPYPRLFNRKSRLTAALTNRDPAAAAQSYQLAFHGMLVY